MKNVINVALVILSISVCAQTSPLTRRAVAGFSLQKLPQGPGAVVAAVADGSPAQKSGLRKGDVVLAINGQSLADNYTLVNVMRALRAGTVVSLSYRRGGSTLQQVQFVPQPRPMEMHSTLQFEAIELVNDYQDHLRGFVTKPKDSRGKVPAILFVSWLSCSSVEIENDTWSKMMRDVAEKSGCLMLRVEKPGVGDSGGIACADCDLDRELNGYQAALRYLKSRPDVDSTRIVLFGGSLGGTLTSVVGKGHRVKAYVTAVSVYKTWLEHMIEHERRRLQLLGTPPAEVSDLMQRFVAFHTAYLRDRKTPAGVAAAMPDLKNLWYDEAGHQYGRLASFYHQVNDINFMKTWSEVEAPVLIVAGGYDWIMSLDDNVLLDQVLKASGKQSTLYIEPQMDHHWATYNTPGEAFTETNGTYAKAAVDYMVEWIRRQVL